MVRGNEKRTIGKYDGRLCARRGYALKNLCDYFDISFNHHDALEDAVATAKTFRLAVEETGLSPEEWLGRVKKPIK